MSEKFMSEQLEYIKEFIESECIEAIKSFSQEEYLSRDEFISITSQIAEIMYTVKSIDSWTRLSYLCGVEHLAVIGKETLDDLLADYDDACKNGMF